jgi:hypothetical protein
MAMIVAITSLMVVTLLMIASVTVAVQTNGSARRDSNQKAALEAAEAGLQIATYRLNMLVPGDTGCVGDAVAGPGSDGTCVSSTYAFGNGSTYKYWTTPILASSGGCAGSVVANATGVSQRCVTAQGVTNGVTVRTQIRIAAFSARPLFPVAGITGIKSITNGNNITINGGEASNGTITAGSNTSITGGVALGPAGAFSGPGSPPISRLPSPIVLSPVDPGTSNQSSLANCPARQTAGYTTCNDNYRITNGINDPSGNTKPFDQSSGFSYNAATRTLATTTNSGATITLGGGIYNFCELDINNNATINLATGVRTEIFIDSPDDPGSGCPSGTGTFNEKNNVSWTNPLNDATALQIYIYGLNNGSNVFTMNNNNTCVCVVYAPQSTVLLSHSSKNSALTGAVSGSVVNVSNNFTFTYSGSAGTLTARTTGVYYRSAWSQCTPQPTTTGNPDSGCG